MSDDPALAAVAERLREVLAGEHTGFSHAYPCDTADGTARNFVMHVRPLLAEPVLAGDETACVGAVVSHVDITEVDVHTLAADRQR